jgi:hypothetical protein
VPFRLGGGVHAVIKRTAACVIVAWLAGLDDPQRVADDDQGCLGRIRAAGELAG